MNHRFFRICLVVLLGLVGFAAPWAQAASVPKTDALSADEQVQTIVWDLTKDQTCVANSELMGWESDFVSFYALRGSSTDDVNSSYPGNGKTITTFGPRTILEFIPHNCTIVSIEVEEDLRSYKGCTWTNANVSNGGINMKFVITPLDGDAPIRMVNDNSRKSWGYVTIHYIPRGTPDSGITDGSEVEDDGTRYQLAGQVSDVSAIHSGVQYALGSVSSSSSELMGYLNGKTIYPQQQLPKSSLYTFETAGSNSKGEVVYFLKNSAGRYFSKPGCEVGYTANRADAWRVTVKRPQRCDSDHEYTDLNNVAHVGMEAYIAEARDKGGELDLSAVTYCDNDAAMVIASAESNDAVDPLSSYTFLMGVANSVTGGTVSRGTDYNSNSWVLYTTEVFTDVEVDADVNADGKTDADDFNREVDIIIGSADLAPDAISRADVNGDGSIDVADVSLITDVINGHGAGKWLNGTRVNSGTISVTGQSNAMVGKTIDAPVSMEDGRHLRDAQFRVSVPKGVALVEVRSYSKQHTAAFRPLSDGTYQVVVASVEGAQMSDAYKQNICHLNFTTDEVAQSVKDSIKVTDFIGTCTDGTISTPNSASATLIVLNADVNYDGTVDMKDFTRELDIIMGRHSTTPDELLRADVNSDGRVNVCDVTAIHQFAHGITAGSLISGLIKATTDNKGKVTFSEGGSIRLKGSERHAVSVNLNDTRGVRDLQFCLTLPESVSLTALNCKYEGYAADFSRVGDNVYQVIISSQTGAVMKDVTNKEICTLQVTVADAFHPQASTCSITNFVYTTSSGIIGTPDDYSIPFVLLNADVNSDDQVDVNDFRHMLDIIVGRYSPTSDELLLADVNGDGRINVLDVTIITSFVNGSTLVSMFSGATDTDATVTLDVTDMVVEGDTISVPVMLKDSRTYVRDMQFKVHVAKGVTLSRVNCNDESSCTVDFNRTGDQEYQVAIASWSARSLRNVKITLKLIVDSTSAPQKPGMTITDFLHTHSNGVTTYPPFIVTGDVNNDGIVNAEDYRRAIDIILERGNTTPDELLRADLNGEGNVNVQDVSYLSDLIRGVKNLYGTTKRENATVGFPSSKGLDIDVENNSFVDIPISFNTYPATMRDMQFKVRLPEGADLVGVTPSFEGYETDFNRLSDGTYRVILHSLDGATIVNDKVTEVCSLRLSIGEMQSSRSNLTIEELMQTLQSKELWWSSNTFKVTLCVRTYPDPKIETESFIQVKAGAQCALGLSFSVRRDILDFQIDMELPYGTQMERVESMVDGYSVTWQDVTENADNTEKDCSTFRFVVEPTGDAVFASLNNITWTKYYIFNALFTLPNKATKEDFYLKNGVARATNGKEVDVTEYPFTIQLIPLEGDVNADGTIDDEDYKSMIDLILGRRDSSVDVKLYADLNGDRKVNIGDASMLSDMIRSLDVSKWIEGYADKTGRLSLSFEGYAIAGTTQELGLILNDSRDVRDIQFTLNLPVGLSLAGVNATYEGYTAEFNRTSERDYLVVVHSLKGATMGDAANKQFCTLMLATDDAVEKGDLWFTIKDFVDTHPDGGISTIIETIAWVHAVNPKANADVNYDGIVDAEDFNREIDIILGRGDSTADSALGDLNEDRKINVGDATLLSDMIRGVDIADMLTGKTDNTGALSAPTGYTLPGKVISIPVYLSDERAVRDVQFKVSVPSGVSLTGIDCKYPGYTAEFNCCGGQTYQVVIYSQEGATMADVASKEVCTLHLIVDKALEAKDYTMVFSGIVDSHPDGVVSYPYDNAVGISVVKQMDADDITDGSEVEDDGSCYKPLEEVWETQIRPGQQYVLASMTMRDEQAGYLNGMTLCNQETLPKSCLYTFESAGRNSKGEPAYYIKNAAGHYFTKPGYKVGYTSNVLAAWKVTVKEPQMWFEPDYEYCWDNPETGEYEELVGADAHIAEYREMGEPLDLSSASYCWSWMIIADAEPHDPADPYSTYTYLLGSGAAQNGTVARGTDYGRNAWRIYTVREWGDDSLNPDINRDGIADEQDFHREIDFILGRETASGNKRADINRDGNVNVGDVTILSELLRGYDVDDMLRTGTGNSGTISFDAVSVLPGSPVDLPVYLQAALQVRDIQFDVDVPEGVELVGVKCNYEEYSTHFHLINNNEYRVVIASLTGARMSETTRKICSLRFDTGRVASSANPNMTVKNVLFTNPNGKLFTTSKSSFSTSFSVQTSLLTIPERIEGERGELVDWPITLIATHDVSSIEALFLIPSFFTVESVESLADGYVATWSRTANPPGLEDTATWGECYRMTFKPQGDTFFPAGETHPVANVVLRFPDQICTPGLYLWQSTITAVDGREFEGSFFGTAVNVKNHPFELVLDFKKGWNWFSYNLEDWEALRNNNFANVFPTDVTYVASQTESMIYVDEDETWFGSVRPSITEGFKAYAQQDVTYRYVGNPVYCGWQSINLYPGWTWFAYLPSVPMMVSEVFTEPIFQEGDVVKSQQSSATYYQGRWIGDFMMEPGQGYQYHTLTHGNSRSFRYPWESATYYQLPARISEPTYDGGYFDFDCHQFRDNMAIIARIADADAHRYVVGAFHGEECCGKSVADQGYHIITAHGEGGDRLKFVILDTMTDTFYEALDGAGAPLTMTFNGTLAGTPDAPVVLSLGARIGDAVTGIRFNGNDADDNADVYHLDGRRAVGASEGIIVKRGRKSFVK